uniref:Protein charybde n=1 Tax=Glossina brevipalpis TaxID=37001 RepID=A0A1A9WG84_9MUSC
MFSTLTWPVLSLFRTNKAVITLPSSTSTEAAAEATSINQCKRCSPITNYNAATTPSHSSHLTSDTVNSSIIPTVPMIATNSIHFDSSNSAVATTPETHSPDLVGIDQIFASLLMKMEVLSLQNHHIHQQQFGVIGSAKVKDWTGSLSPPPEAQLSNLAASGVKQDNSAPTEYLDVVDGIESQHKHFLRPQVHQQLQPTTMAASTTPTHIESTNNAIYTYNNNLLRCSPHTSTANASMSSMYPSALTPSPTSSNLSTPTEATEHFGIAYSNDIDAAAVNELSQRLQAELRAAKSRHLSCTEVSLPSDLTPRIAAEMIKTSEREPCGVKGCAVFIDFGDETGNVRRIAAFKVDPSTVSTFELYLTLKQDKGGWTSILPQFLKNLTRSNTILISPHFTLSKHKIYACE